MDNERAWRGLCGHRFGPKPFCFQTGCYPSAPLEATSHTSHKPIHGNKYVQSCSSEWFLICQIGPFYRQRNCLVSRSGYWPTLLTSREKNWASVKTTHPLWETQIYDPTIFPLLMLQKKKKKNGLPKKHLWLNTDSKIFLFFNNKGCKFCNLKFLVTDFN